MGQSLHIVKDRAILRRKKGLLLDTGVLPHFLDPLGVAALQRRQHFPKFARHRRFDQVQELFSGRPFTSLANVMETLNWGPPSMAAADSTMDLLRSNMTIVSATETLAGDSLAMYILHLERFPEIDAKLRGAADIYTAAAAIRNNCVVVTEDLDDFAKIDGVEFLVGW